MRCLGGLLVALPAFVLFGGTSLAAPVTTVLTLDAPGADNRLELTINDASTTSDLTGTVDAEIEINRITGEITSFQFVGGDLLSTGWSMTPTIDDVGPVPVSTTDSMAIAGTTPDTSAVNSGTFDPEDHFLELTSGTISPGPEPLAGTEIAGGGIGTINSTRNGDQFDIVLSMGINDIEDFSGAELSIVGNMVARGSVTAIPEPSSHVLLVGVGICLANRRRRKAI